MLGTAGSPRSHLRASVRELTLNSTVDSEPGLRCGSRRQPQPRGKRGRQRRGKQRARALLPAAAAAATQSASKPARTGSIAQRAASEKEMMPGATGSSAPPGGRHVAPKTDHEVGDVVWVKWKGKTWCASPSALEPCWYPAWVFELTRCCCPAGIQRS